MVTWQPPMEAMFQLRIDTVTVVKENSEFSVVNKYNKAPDSGDFERSASLFSCCRQSSFRTCKTWIKYPGTKLLWSALTSRKRKKEYSVMRCCFLQNLELGHFPLLVSLRNHDGDGDKNVTNHRVLNNEKQYFCTLSTCIFNICTFHITVLVLFTTCNYIFSRCVDDVSTSRELFLLFRLFFYFFFIIFLK